ncbi:hypothetical protein K438DRAFT_591957 [Mycena galopus ATCC 62051]|nr:hypothetical protein K438DRAFT_591957 [Mycena galopus ATCC 62051]
MSDIWSSGLPSPTSPLKATATNSAWPPSSDNTSVTTNRDFANGSAVMRSLTDTVCGLLPGMGESAAGMGRRGCMLVVTALPPPLAHVLVLPPPSPRVLPLSPRSHLPPTSSSSSRGLHVPSASPSFLVFSSLPPPTRALPPPPFVALMLSCSPSSPTPANPPTVTKLSYAFSQYYELNARQASACAFSGNVTASPSVTDSPSTVLKQCNTSPSSPSGAPGAAGSGSRSGSRERLGARAGRRGR